MVLIEKFILSTFHHLFNIYDQQNVILMVLIIFCLRILCISSNFLMQGLYLIGFPGSSAVKESACDAEDPSLIPGLGSFPGEGIGYPFQYSWASMVAQTVKNPPAIRETWVQSLGWENPLEEGMATQFSILAWRIPMDREACQATVHRWQRVSHNSN